MATRFNSVDDLLNHIMEINAKQIRAEMDRRMHVFVISTSVFMELVRIHLAEVRKIAEKSEDEDVKRQLNAKGFRQPNKLASKLKDRFTAVFVEELNKLPGIKYSVKRQGRVDLYFIEGLKSNKDIFRDLQQSVMKNIRETLVANSRTSSVNKVLALIIAGIDLDYDTDIGDTPLGKYAKGKVLQGAPLSDPKKANKAKGIIAGQRDPIPGAGVQIGHFQGPNTVASIQLRNAVRIAQSGIVGLTGFYYKAQQSVELIHKFDAEARFNKVVYDVANRLTGKVDISIVGLESTANNSYSGAKAGRELRNLTKAISDNAEAIFLAKGSKPVIDLMSEEFIKLFLTGKSSPKSINRKYKKTKTVKKKVKATGINFKTVTDSSDLRELVDRPNINNINLNNLIDFINNKLHDKIRQNMGKGKSKEILNYRTGRFAKSAKLQSFYSLTEKNAVGAQVRYMKYPYAVFEPGGRLHKPGRDPHRLIGRSIRQILQEEKIATLRRVKVKLNG